MPKSLWLSDLSTTRTPNQELSLHPNHQTHWVLTDGLPIVREVRTDGIARVRCRTNDFQQPALVTGHRDRLTERKPNLAVRTS